MKFDLSDLTVLRFGAKTNTQINVAAKILLI